MCSRSKHYKRGLGSSPTNPPLTPRRPHLATSSTALATNKDPALIGLAKTLAAPTTLTAAKTLAAAQATAATIGIRVATTTTMARGTIGGTIVTKETVGAETIAQKTASTGRRDPVDRSA